MTIQIRTKTAVVIADFSRSDDVIRTLEFNQMNNIIRMLQLLHKFIINNGVASKSDSDTVLSGLSESDY